MAAKRSLYGLILVMAVIAHASLYPWHFDFARGSQGIAQTLLGSWPEWNVLALRDAMLNIAVYLPVGAIAFLAARGRRWGDTASVLAALAAGFLLSGSMELLQVYVPGRVASIFDVGCNLAGTAAGALMARVLQKRLTLNGAGRLGRSWFPATLLLLCWTVFQLYPFVPLPSFERVLFEIQVLLKPCEIGYCCCTAEEFLTRVWIATAGWFAVALALESIAGRMRISWLVAAVCIRLALRPLVVTRPLGPDEIIGVILCWLLWRTLRESSRRRAGLWLLVSAVLLLELRPFHLSSIAAPFSWPPFQITFEKIRDGATFDLGQRAFHYGAIIWLLRSAGWPYWKAGVAVAGGLAVIASLQLYLPGRQPSTTDAVLAVLMALVFHLSEGDLKESAATAA